MKKFVEKMKRFWSLDAKTNGGFTLVELIVVIAILAILAGIAVPAYSGYVEKAKKAEDEQLLATVNTAFAAACIENGTDVHSVVGVTDFDEENMVVTGTVTLASGTVVDATAYNESFQDFFAGNEDLEFSTIESIVFDAGSHAFVDPANVEQIALSYGGGTIYISAEDVANLKKSTFANLGTGNLLKKVDEVSTFASALLNGDGSTGAAKLFQELVVSEDYQRSLAAYLGVENADTMDVTELEAAIVEALGEDFEQTPENAMKVWTNGAVLYAAENSSAMTNEEIMALLNSTDPKGDILKNLSGENADLGQGLTQATLLYGMYTSYAYSEEFGSAAAQEQTKDPLAVMSALSDAEFNASFQKYLKTSQAEADLQGYLSSLNMINEGTKDTTAATSVIINGFADQELIDQLEQAVGK